MMLRSGPYAILSAAESRGEAVMLLDERMCRNHRLTLAKC